MSSPSRSLETAATLRHERGRGLESPVPEPARPKQPKGFSDEAVLSTTRSAARRSPRGRRRQPASGLDRSRGRGRVSAATRAPATRGRGAAQRASSHRPCSRPIRAGRPARRMEAVRRTAWRRTIGAASCGATRRSILIGVVLALLVGQIAGPGATAGPGSAAPRPCRAPSRSAPSARRRRSLAVPPPTTFGPIINPSLGHRRHADPDPGHHAGPHAVADTDPEPSPTVRAHGRRPSRPPKPTPKPPPPTPPPNADPDAGGHAAADAATASRHGRRSRCDFPTLSSTVNSSTDVEHPGEQRSSGTPARAGTCDAGGNPTAIYLVPGRYDLPRGLHRPARHVTGARRRHTVSAMSATVRLRFWWRGRWRNRGRWYTPRALPGGA